MKMTLNRGGDEDGDGHCDHSGYDTVNEMMCTYCGHSIEEDVVQCPYCQNFTDGLGRFAEKDERLPGQLPWYFKLGAWLVIICMLLPLLRVLWNWLKTGHI